MRLVAVFGKTMREMRRELAILLLTLAFAPAFVVLYRVVFPSYVPTYKIVMIDHDKGTTTAGGAQMHAGADLRAALSAMKDSSGRQLLKVNSATNREQAVGLLENRDADALLIVPAVFSAALAAATEAQSARSGGGSLSAGGSPSAASSAAPATVEMVGDLTSSGYAVAMTLAMAGLEGYVQSVTGQSLPVRVAETPMGGSGARTDFELYVPGLLVFAVVLLVFLAAMTLAREAEAGTLRRLQITGMSSFDLLGGISIALMSVGTASVTLTFFVAWALGFRSQGPIWVALLVGAVTSLSIIGVGLVVACFSRTVSQAFVIANFPLGLLMLFTGAVFPIPRAELFTVAGHGISPFDLLPPTHAVIALNKVLTLGEGLGAVAYELGALVVLTALYLAIGVWLFKRLRMRAA